MGPVRVRIRVGKRRLGLAALVGGAILAAGLVGSGAQARGAGDDRNAKQEATGLSAPLERRLQGSLVDLYLRSAELTAADTPVTAAALSRRSARLAGAIARRSLRFDAGGAVQVEAVIDGEGPSAAALRALGVTVERRRPAGGLAQYRAPSGQLGALASLEGVRRLRPPTYRVATRGSITTEGVTALRADLAQQVHGVTGAGVRVGVISDGITGIVASQASGDAPSLLASQSFSAEGLGAGSEGTAMIEIVHDVAPDAQISFANADTVLDFMDAVNYLAERNDIVLDDLAWFYIDNQQSPVSVNTADALNHPFWPIRAYFVAVGNFADRHYQGSYTAGPEGTTALGLRFAGAVHTFAPSADTIDALGRRALPYNEVFLGTGQRVTVALLWEDSQNNAANDYDLYLLDEDNGEVAFGNDTQDGTDGSSPSEQLEFTNTGAPGFFRIVVQNFENRAEPRLLELYAASGDPYLPGGATVFNFNTAASSILGESDAGGGVISLGTIDQSDPGLDDVQVYSSWGPTNNGALKPELVAVDGVAVTGNGGFGEFGPDGQIRFYGTSAASPHAGGVAALLLSARPALMAGDGGDPANERALVRSLLLNSAIDLGAAGPDNTFGYGRIDAVAALALRPMQSLVLNVAAASVEQRTPTPLTATVSDINGNPLAGALVRFSEAPAGGEVSQTFDFVTNAEGVASVNFSGDEPGVVVLTATLIDIVAGQETVTELTASVTITVVPLPASRSLTLARGWNNVTWSGAATPVAAAITAISGSVEAVWAWDATVQAWKSFTPGAPAILNTLTALEPGQVLWIRLRRVNLEWAQPVDAASRHLTSVALNRSWNNVAWGGEEAVAVADALSPILSVVRAVWVWDAATQRWRSFIPGAPAVANTLTTLDLGVTLWIFSARADVVWEQATTPG